MNKKINLIEFLFFLLGLFSTLQLVTLSGVTLFVWMLLGIAFLLILRISIIKIKMSWMLLWMISICISEMMMLVSNADENWINASFRNFIILVGMFIVLLYLKELDIIYWKYFLKGIYYSGMINVVWGYSQFILYRVFDIDLNALVFNDILNSNEVVSQYKDGEMIITGLNSNAGILTPIIVVTFYLAQKKSIKMFTIILLLICGSSTTMLTGLACILLEIVRLIYRNLNYKKTSLKISRKIISKILLTLPVVLIMGIVLFSRFDLLDRIVNIYNALTSRIGSVLENEISDGSTYAHYRYYYAIPNIIKQIDIGKLLFGYGCGAAGLPFVIYYQQYSDIVWVPESDVVTILFNNGIVGFLIFYSLLFFILFKARKMDYKCSSIMILLIVAGIFYTVQLVWVVMFEFLLVEVINRKMRLKDLMTFDKSTLSKTK